MFLWSCSNSERWPIPNTSHHDTKHTHTLLSPRLTNQSFHYARVVTSSDSKPFIHTHIESDTGSVHGAMRPLSPILDRSHASSKSLLVTHTFTKTVQFELLTLLSTLLLFIFLKGNCLIEPSSHWVHAILMERCFCL